MRRFGWLTIAGAALPLVLGATLGMVAAEDADTVAGTVAPGAFVALEVGLAVAHLLVLCGYLGVLRVATGTARTFTLVAASGTAAVAAVELWAGALAETSRDSGMATALNVAYGVTAAAIAVGTVGAGLAVRSYARRLATPLLVNGLFLGLVVLPLRFVTPDAVAIGLLTLWGLTYIWLGVALVRTAGDAALVGAETTAP